MYCLSAYNLFSFLLTEFQNTEVISFLILAFLLNSSLYVS